MIRLSLPGLVPGPLQFSPDGSLLAVAAPEHPLRVFVAATGRLLWAADPEFGEWGAAVSFSADGRRVVRCRPVSTIYDAGSGAKVWPLPEDEWPGRADWPLPIGFPVARSACGRWAIGSGNGFGAAAGGLMLPVGSMVGEWLNRPLGPQRAIQPLAFSPDGDWLAVGGPLTVVRTADLAARLVGPSPAPAVVRLGPTPPPPPPPRRGRRPQPAPDPGRWAAAFSPDGRALYAVCDEAVVRVWDTATWAERATLDLAAGPLGGVAVSPDGLRAAATAAGAVVVWDVD